MLEPLGMLPTNSNAAGSGAYVVSSVPPVARIPADHVPDTSVMVIVLSASLVSETMPVGGN